MDHSSSNRLFSTMVIVAALGYFVDIYDLLLFSIIRIPSLKALGLSGDNLKLMGEHIISIQMLGLLIGGIIWGVMGDKKGRLSVLFGSIVLYSLANIANGFVETTTQYAIVRFIAGLGLAGELGAGITLVSEQTAKHNRGVATSLVAGIGLLGAVVAFFLSVEFSWRTCYFIGGGLGLALLALRISVFESGMFHEAKKEQVARGNFFMFFNNRHRFVQYLCSILVGLPTWFVIGVLVTFSDSFAKYLGITEAVSPGKAVMYAYGAIAVGDVAVGLLSQKLKSRKSALYIFYAITVLFMILFFTTPRSAQSLYWICAGLGFGTGFWAIFVTMAAEQFGTNLRATAATTVPNMVRGMLAVLIIPVYRGIANWKGDFTSGWICAILFMTISVIAAMNLRETFGKDLNYVER